jgi:hypothetical protein
MNRWTTVYKASRKNRIAKVQASRGKKRKWGGSSWNRRGWRLKGWQGRLRRSHRIWRRMRKESLTVVLYVMKNNRDSTTSLMKTSSTWPTVMMWVKRKSRTGIWRFRNQATLTPCRLRTATIELVSTNKANYCLWVYSTCPEWNN